MRLRIPILTVILITAITFTTNADTIQPALTLDFELDAVDQPLLPGQIIDHELAAIGVHISAHNNHRRHPDLAIIFDSANPTGGDHDLLTPNPDLHPSNTIAYGNVLILAENDRDRNRDGLIDNPDDEGRRPAGYIHFDLDNTYSAADFALIDIEETGGFIEFFRNDQNAGIANIPSTGDGGIVNLAFANSDFDAFRVNLAGSGAIAQVNLIPEPASLALILLGLTSLTRRR